MARYRKVMNAAGLMGWTRLVPFIYSLDLNAVALADGNSLNGSLTTDPGLPFICTDLRVKCDIGDTTDTDIQTPLLFACQDGANQALFSNVQVPREAMFGTRKFPRQFATEIEIPPSDTLTWTVTNNTGAPLTDIIRISMIGYRLMGFWSMKPEE